MEEIFATQASNEHQCLLLGDISKWQCITSSINRKSLRDGWEPLRFTLESLDNKTVKPPSICTVYLPGVLAVSAAKGSALFLEEQDRIELLPIFVGNEPWLLLNCLMNVSLIDEQESQLMRGGTGEIFMVLKLRVTDPIAKDCEVFTLTDSNRGQLFARESFRRRVDLLGLEGITFQKIGELAVASSD